jgi:hypothetical protein
VKADQLGKHLDDSAGTDAAGDIDSQAFARKLVDHRQAFELLAIGAGVEDEIVCPDLICRQRRQRLRAVAGHALAWPLSGHL